MALTPNPDPEPDPEPRTPAQPRGDLQLYTSGGSDLVSTLTMNNRWFAATLGRMAADVERQPPNPGKAGLLSRLRAIQKETEALERQAERQQRQG